MTNYPIILLYSQICLDSDYVSFFIELYPCFKKLDETFIIFESPESKLFIVFDFIPSFNKRSFKNVLVEGGLRVYHEFHTNCKPLSNGLLKSGLKSYQNASLYFSTPLPWPSSLSPLLSSRETRAA